MSFSQDVEIEIYASGLDKPVNIKHAGDDRLFVAERKGTIQIVNTDGSINATPFLDINGRVSNNGGEQGLLGLAFHPDYSTNGFFFVNYINNNGNTVISRFTTNPPTSSTADPNSELQLMTLIQPYSNHNGGDLAFGPDGFLYIAVGDGGAGGDPEDRAQNINSVFGKLLRIDVDNTSNGNNYAIPDDNPLNGNPNAVDEIWAYGLRNPWKFSFDSMTNELWIADVGQNLIEEINVAPYTSPALNYGWRCYEGNATYNTTDCPPAATLEYPVAQYSHSGNGPFKCSITGGYRYRGSAQPNLYGLYFFADYCSDEIGMLEDNGGNWTMTFTEQYSGSGWSAFGEDVNGELYIAGIETVNMYKLIDASVSVDESEAFKVKIYPNPVSDILTFDTSQSLKRIKLITIYNIHGKIVKSIKTTNESLHHISTSNLLSGFYILKITAENGHEKLSKLIKN